MNEAEKSILQYELPAWASGLILFAVLAGVIGCTYYLACQKLRLPLRLF